MFISLLSAFCLLSVSVSPEGADGRKRQATLLAKGKVPCNRTVPYCICCTALVLYEHEYVLPFLLTGQNQTRRKTGMSAGDPSASTQHARVCSKPYSMAVNLGRIAVDSCEFS